MRIHAALASALFAATLATGALAAAADDGNAGLDALNAGDYDKAIALFTRAIKSGQLAGDDKEFAYLNRGKAYLAKHNYAKAVADLTAAVRINPGDDDAKAALRDAQASHAGGTAPLAAARGWGVLAALAGHYYWYDIAGKPPHRTFVYYDWLTPQTVLRYTVSSKDDKLAVGEYLLDPATGRIIEAEAFPSGVYYGTAVPSRGGDTEYFFLDGVALRTVSTGSAGSIGQKTQRFAGGAWQDISASQMVATTEAELQAAGFLKK
ncbi:MAG: tetratricopeptide repeat protein [Rhizomicrobium sp.]